MPSFQHVVARVADNATKGVCKVWHGTRKARNEITEAGRTASRSARMRWKLENAKNSGIEWRDT